MSRADKEGHRVSVYSLSRSQRIERHAGWFRIVGHRGRRLGVRLVTPDRWIDAAWITLAPEDLDEIAAAIQRTGAGIGPVSPASRSRRRSDRARHEEPVA